MKIIYHCFGGTHSSVVAAALHLGWIDPHRLPAPDELRSLPYFDRRSPGMEGWILFLGRDRYNNEVYVVGKRGMGETFENLIGGLTQALDLPREEVLLLNTSPLVNWLMAVGGFLSRRLGITLLGRPLVIWGVRRIFTRLVTFVQECRLLWEINR
ncbi:MAG: DUF3189 family protein [Thermoanaerobacteraceae bacterium]|uniref:DUF3189 family protein n=1 Tax=Thermanaeromonas sp. C210 TaxID=2731925 RepID=UPI00155C39FE|nr:DUF3189 family protein [Thermanaeromonas sp. C210]MBE3581553.1 DUF3189 family protein [Thermoanaerobacteraceae bacterium]GFN23471.1 hypothetical protein TAMC210_17880 [Thermanaeromonas sp. C210]